MKKSSKKEAKKAEKLAAILHLAKFCLAIRILCFWVKPFGEPPRP